MVVFARHVLTLRRRWKRRRGRNASGRGQAYSACLLGDVERELIFAGTNNGWRKLCLLCGKHFQTARGSGTGVTSDKLDDSRSLFVLFTLEN